MPCSNKKGDTILDKGPWYVPDYKGVQADRIDSEDFTHDASLILYGDFAEENKGPYLEFIAKELNDCPKLRKNMGKLMKVVKEILLTPDHGYEKGIWIERTRFNSLCKVVEEIEKRK